MSALTGVGPSIASGSQTWKGNCADLPIAPRKISSVATVSVPPSIPPCSAMWKIVDMSKVSVLRKSRMIPMSRPTSPILVVMNAFFAASAADLRSHQNPDQQVGAQSYKLPCQVEKDEVVRQHKGQHGSGEQGMDGVVPP